MSISIGVTVKPSPGDIIVPYCKPRKAGAKGMRQNLQGISSFDNSVLKQ